MGVAEQLPDHGRGDELGRVGLPQRVGVDAAVRPTRSATCASPGRPVAPAAAGARASWRGAVSVARQPERWGGLRWPGSSDLAVSPDIAWPSAGCAGTV